MKLILESGSRGQDPRTYESVSEGALSLGCFRASNWSTLPCLVAVLTALNIHFIR